MSSFQSPSSSLSLLCFSPIFCATKHRGGGGDVFRFCPCSDFMSHTPQCCGARQGRSLEVALYSFAMSRGSGLYFFYFNPLAPWALPLYSLTETPRNATGHGRGEGEMYFPFASVPILYATPRNATGTAREVVGSSLFFFFLGYSRNENRCI